MKRPRYMMSPLPEFSTQDGRDAFVKNHPIGKIHHHHHHYHHYHHHNHNHNNHNNHNNHYNHDHDHHQQQHR